MPQAFAFEEVSRYPSKGAQSHGANLHKGHRVREQLLSSCPPTLQRAELAGTTAPRMLEKRLHPEQMLPLSWLNESLCPLAMVSVSSQCVQPRDRPHLLLKRERIIRWLLHCV